MIRIWVEPAHAEPLRATLKLVDFRSDFTREGAAATLNELTHIVRTWVLELATEWGVTLR